VRHTHSSKEAGTGLSLRLFQQSATVGVWLIGAALIAMNAYGQTSMLSTPQDLLKTDPRLFADWLETTRPKPVSAQDRARSLRTLPAEGEVTNLNDAVRLKLSALRQLLRATGHDSDYEIKVIDIPLARIGLFERSVVLISENALALTDGEDLQALMAHELGHEYVLAEYQRASKRSNYNRLKQLELMCDAIAIVILDGLGLDPSRLMTSVERITRYNREFRGPLVDERGYPTLSERWAFARAVTAWIAAPRTASQRETHLAHSSTSPRASRDPTEWD
jgi:hypothetical protein